MNVGYIKFRYPPSTLEQFVRKQGALGAVYLRVKLVNGSDDALFLEGKLPGEKVRCCEVDALVDTGSNRCAVPQSVYEQLGLGDAGRLEVEYADGSGEQVILTTPIRFVIDGRSTFDEAAVLGNEVVIGQTVLEKTGLLVDCANRRVVENPKHPGGPRARF